MIRAVLFDLHGVITASPWAGLAAVGTHTGASEDAVLRILLGDYAADTDHPWHRLERGEIGILEWVQSVTKDAEAAGIAFDWNRVRGLTGRLDVNDRVVSRIRSLRAEGYLTGLVTNNVREAASSWQESLPVDELFDVIVDSSVLGVRKPNPAIFRRALEELGGVAAEEAVFLDDSPGNVAGARAAGLHAIEVGDIDDALAELDALLASLR